MVSSRIQVFSSGQFRCGTSRSANNAINADPETRRAFCGLAALDFATKSTPVFGSGYGGR